MSDGGLNRTGMNRPGIAGGSNFREEEAMSKLQSLFIRFRFGSIVFPYRHNARTVREVSTEIKYPPFQL